MPSSHARHAQPTTRGWRWVAVAAVALAGLGLAACGDDSGSADTTEVGAAQAHSAPTLADSSWVLSTYTGPSGKDVPAVTSPAAPLEFAADSLSGSTGCNQFAGTYETDGDALTITLGPVTRKACAPVSLQAQETAVLALLPKVASFSIDSDTLTMRDSDDATVLVYTLGLASLEGTSWTATGVNNGKEAVEANAQTEHVTATFGPNGALSGSGGCNDYTAEYTVSGSDGLDDRPDRGDEEALPR